MKPVVRFYDNDSSRFFGNKKAECIRIDDSQKNDLIQEKEYHNMLYYQEYMKRYNRKGLYQLSIDFPFLKIDYDSFPTNGFSSYHAQELKKWCHQHKNKKKIIFLDWDQTLSVKNGILIMINLESSQLKEYVIYLMGGIERFLMLRKLFLYLHHRNCEIFILTNNNSSEHRNVCGRTFFLQLIQCIFPYFEKENLLYGGYFQDTWQKSNKIHYIENILEFSF